MDLNNLTETQIYTITEDTVAVFNLQIQHILEGSYPVEESIKNLISLQDKWGIIVVLLNNIIVLQQMHELT